MPKRDLSPKTSLRRWLALGMGALALAVVTSQFHCASAQGYADDPLNNGGDGGSSDGSLDGSDDVRCFVGTPTNELQLLTRCTEAERVERAARIPLKTWDPKNPLPYGP